MIDENSAESDGGIGGPGGGALLTAQSKAENRLIDAARRFRRALDEYDTEFPEEGELVKKAGAAIISKQFLNADEKKEAGLYQAAIRYSAVLDVALHALGRSMKINNPSGYVGNVPVVNFGRPAMLGKHETLFLLVMFDDYEQRMRDFDLEDGNRRGQAANSVQELMERYQLLCKCEPPSYTTASAVFRKLASHGLCDLETDSEMFELVYTRPAIREVVTMDFLKIAAPLLAGGDAASSADETVVEGDDSAREEAV